MKKTPPITTPAAGAILGLLVGVADWMCLYFSWGNARAGEWYLPPLTWLTVIATSATLCCFVAALLVSPKVSALRAIMLALAGPGVLLVSRALAPLRRLTGGSTAVAALICAIAIAIVAGTLHRLPAKPSRFNSAWLTASLISGLTLIYLAWNPSFGPSRRETQPSRHPNVVLIFLDTVRYDDALGGAHPAMPQLRAFADRSTSYENAWAPAPWTVPSHLAVLLGREPWTLPPFEKKEFTFPGVTLSERFRARGYETAAISANPLLGNPYFFRGYTHFTYSNASGVCRSAAGNLLSRTWVLGLPRSPVCGWFTSPEVTRRAEHFIASARRPFFLTLNYMDGHYPYYVPAECSDLHRFAMSRRDREIFHHLGAATLPSVVLDHAHSQYRAALTCMDRSLGALLAVLDREPDTVVAVVGDHGEQFGEHNLVEHGNSVYRQLLQVPFVIRAAGQPRSRMTSPITITDLYSFILSASAVHDPGLVDRPIVSSYYVWSGPLSATGAFSAVIGDFHYMRWRDGREALFNYVLDPAEARAVSPSDPRLLESLRSETSRAAMEEQQLNEFHALGYLQ